VQPTPYSEFYFWKFGIGPFVTIIGLCYAGRNRLKLVAVGIGLILAYVSITHEARSLAAFTLLGTLSVIVVKKKVQFETTPKNQGKRGHFLLVSISLSVVIYLSYSLAASHGLLGQIEYQRVQILQNSSLGPLAGRSEFAYSIPAFLERPIIGYGYNPNVSAIFLLNRSTALAAAGVSNSDSVPGTEKLPVHSYLMQSLIVGGFLAGFFWLFVLGIMIRLLKRIDRIFSPWVPVLTYLSISLIWAILFSPYGAGSRLSAMLTLALSLAVLSDTEEKGSIQLV